MKPQRVQLRRVKGWRMPANTVKVCRPTKWGNKFRLGDHVQEYGKDGVSIKLLNTPTDVVDTFRRWLEIHMEQHPVIMRAALDELRGKNLACWCQPDQPCHADVLLELANR